MKIKCIKLDKCPICSKGGSCQLFFNKAGKLKYARVRHYILKGEKGYDANKKYNFSYCKIENLRQLEALLKTLEFQFPTEAETSRSLGQVVGLKNHDPQLGVQASFAKIGGRVAQYG
jgi:hypothetical protein